MSAFNMLSEPFQRYLFERNITRELPIQEVGIPKIITTDRNYILASGTGSGKTFAVFAANGSRSDFDGPGVPILYIAPTNSLIGDMCSRLKELFSYCDVRVTAWTGDSKQSEKKALLRSPEGVVLMTPESLEAMYETHPEYVRLLFKELRACVVDEIHVFIGTDRGILLKSLLSRLMMSCAVPFRFYGLSATVGEDVAPFKTFVDNGRETTVLLDPSMRHTDVQFGYYPVTKRGEIPQEACQRISELMTGQRVIIYPRSKADVEELAYKLTQLGHVNSFAYHASLDKKIRKEIEEYAREVEDDEFGMTSTTASGVGENFCGITRIIQLNAVPSVSMLVQRAGRGGRRTGQGDLVVINTDPWSLLQNVACWNLHEKGIIEKYDTGLSPNRVLAHQIRSIVKESGEISREELKEEILSNNAFRGCDGETVDKIIDYHLEKDLLRKEENDKLIIGASGEKYVGHMDSYVVFDVKNEFRVTDGKTCIGKWDQGVCVGDTLFLAKRSWRVTGTEGHVIYVQESTGGKPPRFTSESLIVSPEVEAEMRRILVEKEIPGYLDGDAAEEFKDIVGAFSHLATMGSWRIPCFKSKGNQICLYPLAGTKVLNTLSLLFETPSDGRLLELNLSLEELLKKTRNLISNPPELTAMILPMIESGEIEIKSKKELTLPPESQAESLVSRKYDIAGAVDFLNALQEGSDGLELPVLETTPEEVMKPSMQEESPVEQGPSGCDEDVADEDAEGTRLPEDGTDTVTPEP